MIKGFQIPINGVIKLVNINGILTKHNQMALFTFMGMVNLVS